MPDDAPTDPMRILRALTGHAVDFVVIGGVAVQHHGHPRTTRDVDIVVAGDDVNLGRLSRALRELRARLLGVDADLLGVDPYDPRALRDGGNFTLVGTGGEMTLWTDAELVAGAIPWSGLRDRAEETVVSGARFRVVGLDDLIAMKRAAGRVRDLADVAALTDLDEEGDVGTEQGHADTQ